MQQEIGNEIRKKYVKLKDVKKRIRHAFVQWTEYFVRLIDVAINFDIGEANL